MLPGRQDRLELVEIPEVFLGVLRPQICWSHVDRLCVLSSVILSMVQFSSMRSKTVLGYICQDKGLAVRLLFWRLAKLPHHCGPCNLFRLCSSVSCWLSSEFLSGRTFSLVLTSVCRYVLLDGRLYSFANVHTAAVKITEAI